MPPKVKKRGNWTAEQLEAAVNQVRGNELSQREAAQRYNIPRRTLRNHIKSGVLKKIIGRASILTPDQERQFSERIVRLCEIGMPLTPMLVRRSVYKFCVMNNIRHPFDASKGVAGKDWLYAFMKRNPLLARRKAQLMNPARAQKLNKFIVGDHFNKLANIFNEMNLHQNPQNLYNMDEKGCRITIHHQQLVIGQKGTKRVHLVAPEHAENVTIAGCCNALGNSIPPMVIFKGKRLKPEWEENLPQGTLVKMAEKGSMTNELFTHFLRHLKRYKGPDPILLVFDGAASHLDISITEVADELDIRLFCLPSNTTHELQPLDKAVYRSFEHNWDQEVLRFWEANPDRRLNKSRFGKILCKVWPRCMTPDNIISGFRATGLYPLDRTAIPESAFAPSLATERPYVAGIDENHANIDNDHPNIDNVVQSNDNDSDDSEDGIPLSTLKKVIQQKVPNRIESGETNVKANESTQAQEETNIKANEPMQAQEETPVKANDSTQAQEETPVTAKELTQTEEENEDLNTSFKELLPTPELFKLKENKTSSRKSLNYKAQLVTKDLFPSTSSKSKPKVPKIIKKKLEKKQPIPSTSSKVLVRRRPEDNLSKVESWYCFVCNKTEQLDMRSCLSCGTWCHEMCVGFTKNDKDDFICVRCE